MEESQCLLENPAVAIVVGIAADILVNILCDAGKKLFGMIHTEEKSFRSNSRTISRKM